MKRILAVLLASIAAASPADVVHVYERTLAGGVAAQIADRVLDTGREYRTSPAPEKRGYVFTGWTISTQQPFSSRDDWGRALDAAAFTLYEETTLTANYLPASQDSDGDGVPDGYEIYWYGDISQNGASDTDGDGSTFAEELAAGTNPLFPERREEGPVACAGGELLQYNPLSYQPYTIRSEPEGALFATVSDYKRPGETIATEAVFSPGAYSEFAYWSENGVRRADAWGRSVDSVAFSMPSNAVELVAVAESDPDARMALYWYGSREVAMDSDTDGDGRTFAEELAAGTNPLFPERREEGPVAYAGGELLQYNPLSYQPYTIRSEPEGALFATVSDYKRPGETIATEAVFSPGAYSEFAYWSENGVRRADAWGRAADSVAFSMPSNAVELVAVAESDPDARMALYWYGSREVAMDSDTDGDGSTFAEELAAGTNPLFPERREEGPVAYADTVEHEMNLQPYEQVGGAVVDGAYRQIFASPASGGDMAGETFGGGAVWPVVADFDGDGLWDLAVCRSVAGGAAEALIFRNAGSKGNPEFEAGDAALAAASGTDLAMNSPDKLAGFALDVPAPADALSATTNGATLLVSDAEGRIWYYEAVIGEAEQPIWRLCHKVWGGSYAGFAEGLRLAAVDWDDDGDLDCLAGTADGKLMLLRDPRVGRPVNLKADAGVDTVVLTWDPNRQSRIRGYNVYRAPLDGGDGGDFALVASPALPAYRDAPPETAAYAYAVSSVSRFYTAGNSTPTVSESPRSETVEAATGGVKFFWTDAAAKAGDRVEVMLSIENAMNFDVSGRSETVFYDPEYLEPVEVLKTGLTEGCDIRDSVAPGGEWKVEMAGGALPAGGGKFLVFAFKALKAGETRAGGALVSIAPGSGVAPWRLGDLDGDGDVDSDDLKLLARLKNGNGQHPTSRQLQAGDFNGNGKLDNADYQALKAMLKKKGSK